MRTYVKKSLIYIACAVVLLSTLFFAASGFEAIGAYAAISDSMEMTINVNGGRQGYTANELYAQGNSVAGSVSYTNFEGTEQPFAVIDSIVYAVSYDSSEQKLYIEPKVVGSSVFEVRLSVDGQDTVLMVTVNTVSQIPTVFPQGSTSGTGGDPIPANTPITVSLPNNAAFTVSKNVLTTVDFFTDVEYAGSIPNIIALKDRMRSEVGLLALGKTCLIESVSSDDMTVSFDSKNNGSGVTMNFTAMYTGDAGTVSADVTFRFTSGSNDKLIIRFVFRVGSNSGTSSVLTAKGSDDTMQTLYGMQPRRITFESLFENVSGNDISMTAGENWLQLMDYNSAVVSLEPITNAAGDRITGMNIVPVSNGFTPIAFSVQNRRTDGTLVSTETVTIPVEVTGIYTRLSKEGYTGKDMQMVSADFTEAYADGFILGEGEATVSEGGVAKAEVKNGKLVVTPTGVGTAIVTVTMYNPLVGKNIADSLTGTDVPATISVELSVLVKPYSFFDSLTTTGYIVFGVLAGIAFLLILYIILSTIIRGVKHRKQKKEFDREAAKKLAYKKELQDKQRAQQLAMMRAMTPPQMQNPMQPVLSLGVGVGAPPTANMAQPLMLMGTTQSQQSKPKGSLLQLTDGTPQTEEDFRAVDTGAKKAEDFIREAEEKARREAEAARLEKKRAKEEQRQKAEEEKHRKIEEEKRKKAMEEAKKQAAQTDAEICELMKSCNELKKTVFVRDYDIQLLDRDKKEVTEKLPNAETDAEVETLKAQLESITVKTKEVRSELLEKEQEKKDADASLEEKKKSFVDLLKDYEELDAFAAEFLTKRTTLEKNLNEEYEKYIKAYMDDADNSNMLENLSRMQEEMKRQAEKKKEQEFRQLIDAKLSALSGICEDAAKAESITDILALDGRVTGFETALVETEKIPEVLGKLAETKNLLLARRKDLEDFEKQKQTEQEKVVQAKSQEVLEINEKLIAAYREQIESDKQLFVLEDRKNKAQNLIKQYSQEAATCDTEEESKRLTVQIDEQNALLAKIKGDIFQLESSADVKSEESARNQNRMLAIIKEYGLDELRRELEHKNDLAQRDMQADYDRFVAEYKEDAVRREQLEQADRLRRQMKEKEEALRLRALGEMVKAKAKALRTIVDDIHSADSPDQLRRYRQSLRDFKDELDEQENVPEIAKLMADADAAADEIDARLKERAAGSEKSQKEQREKEERIVAAASRVRAKISKIRLAIPDIKTREESERLLANLEEIEDGVDDELKNDARIALPIEKCRTALKHAGDIADVKNRRPKKKIVKTVVKKKPSASSAGTGKKTASSKTKSGSGTKSGTGKPSSTAKKKGVKSSAGSGVKKPASKSGVKKPVKKK